MVSLKINPRIKKKYLYAYQGNDFHRFYMTHPKCYMGPHTIFYIMSYDLWETDNALSFGGTGSNQGRKNAINIG